MSILPVPERSRALFIGVDTFEHLEDLPAVGRNLSTLVNLFAEEVWGLGAEHSVQLLNPSSLREVDEAVFRTAEAASDTLLVYYAGHGLLDRKGQLYLAMPGSDERFVHSTALPYDWVRMGLAASSAQRCIVILDCCFSARAMGLQSSPSTMIELAEAEGTYVIAAAAENAVALAPPGEAYTAFTGALVSVLSDGVADASKLLDLNTVFTALKAILKRQGRPDPQSLERNQVGRLAFAKNPAYVPDRSGTPDTAVQELHRARSLADTLQAVADGVKDGLGYELACVHLVRPDGDLVAASFAGHPSIEDMIVGRITSRSAWDRLLETGERWGDLRFLPRGEGQAPNEDDLPNRHHLGPVPPLKDAWHPTDRLLAPIYTEYPEGDGRRELTGIICVDRPRSRRLPSQEQREALQSYAFHAGLAINQSRLRANMQRALVRLEREQTALRASEGSFRQAFEYAPSGLAISEMGGNKHGILLRTNDALCRLLGRPAPVLRRHKFYDFIHPEDANILMNTSADNGHAEVRLGLRDGTYIWVSLRHSVVADTADGPRFLLTHVEDIEERKLRELQLLHQVSHDSLTGLPNITDARARLSARLCNTPDKPTDQRNPPTDKSGARHTHLKAPDGSAQGGATSLAILLCDLDDFKPINDRFGHHTGDAVLIEVARRLSSASPDTCQVARVGGNEFAVLATGVTIAGAKQLAATLEAVIIPPISVDGRTIQVGASFAIGWAHCGMTADESFKAVGKQVFVEKQSRRERR